MKKLFIALFLVFALTCLSFPQAKIGSGIKVGGGLKIASNTAAGPSDLLTGLVSYWKLEEASGSRADSAGSNTLTDNNTVTSATGVIGNAASFAAANLEYLSVADNASLSFSTTFSVSFWMNQTSAIAVNRVPISKWIQAGTDSEWLGSTIGTGAEFRFFIANAAGDSGGNVGDTTNAAMVADTLYHFVVVYDGNLTGNANRLKIYLNGTQKTLSFVGTIAASLPSTAAPLWVGAWSTSVTRPFNGSIDEVGLWNVALTSGQAARLYNAGAGCQHSFAACP